MSSIGTFTDVVFPEVFSLCLTYYYQAQGLSEIFHLNGSRTLSVYDTIQNYLSKLRLKGPLVKQFICFPENFFFLLFQAHDLTKSAYLWSLICEQWFSLLN